MTRMFATTILVCAAGAIGCVAGDPAQDEIASAVTYSGTDRNPAAFPAPGQPYNPSFEPAEMDAHVDAPFNPLPVGAHWRFRQVSPDGTEIIDINVKPGTALIVGAHARIVTDVDHRDGALIESTTDWFVQDDDDNVWYVGEATSAFEDGTVSHEGSWKTGVHGAKPGIQMLANPRIGDKYRQEYLKGHAEDYAIVIGFDKSVTVPAGTFHGCMQTRDKSTLDLTLTEKKTYCPGIGLVLTEEGSLREELIAYSGL